jgi:hypothetical protein
MENSQTPTVNQPNITNNIPFTCLPVDNFDYYINENGKKSI